MGKRDNGETTKSNEKFVASASNAKSLDLPTVNIEKLFKDHNVPDKHKSALRDQITHLGMEYNI